MASLSALGGPRIEHANVAIHQKTHYANSGFFAIWSKYYSRSFRRSTKRSFYPLDDLQIKIKKNYELEPVVLWATADLLAALGQRLRLS
ncbi:hypothetical protein ACEV93_18530 [Vibrio parahaemolyticus]